MFEYLQNNPSKKTNRILLSVGTIIFIPVYYLNYLTILKILEPDTLTKLLKSFDTRYFEEIMFFAGQRGQLNDFFKVFLLNIVSITGFALIFFPITLIIARSIPRASKIYKISFIHPFIITAIAFFDVLSSVLFLIIIKNPTFISDSTTFCICGSYVFRMILIYIELMWIVVMGIFLTTSNFKRRVYGVD